MVKMLNIWLVAAALVGLLFSPFLCCALVGLTLAVVLFPLHRKLAVLFERHGTKASRLRARNLSALVTELAALLVIVFGLCIPTLILYHNRHFLADKSIALYQRSLDWGAEQKRALGDWMDLQEPDTAVDAAEVAGPGNLKQLVDSLPPLGPLALQTAGAAVLWSVKLLVMLLILHVSLLFGPELWGHIVGHVPGPWDKVLLRLGLRAQVVLRGVYLLHGLTAVAAFLIAVPVFWFILGPPYFFLAAVLAGLFQFIPLLGSVVLVTAMTVYFFVGGEALRGWECLCLAFPLVVGVPDLVIRPALARTQGMISPFTMLIGFTAGIGAFGPAGFVLGPLILELFVTFTRILLEGPDPENISLARE
jgi:predicted PurR-regulated permease PerM